MFVSSRGPATSRGPRRPLHGLFRCLDEGTRPDRIDGRTTVGLVAAQRAPHTGQIGAQPRERIEMFLLDRACESAHDLGLPATSDELRELVEAQVVEEVRSVL